MNLRSIKLLNVYVLCSNDLLVYAAGTALGKGCVVSMLCSIACGVSAFVAT